MSTFTSAVTTAAIVAGLGRGSCPGFDVVSSWRHAVATALSAQMMARSRGHDAEAAYVGGLLHDVGRLVLAAHFPAPFSATLAHVTSHGEAPLDVERELLGLDHAEVGAMVAAHWRLPTRLVEAIAHHHELDGGDDRGLLDLLHVADNVTYALGVSGSADEIVPAALVGRLDARRPRGERPGAAVSRKSRRACRASASPTRPGSAMSESAARIALGRTTSDAVANADVVASSSTSAIDQSPSPFRRLCQRAARWLGRSLGRRFVVGSLGLLLVVQLVSFLAIDASMERHARRALPEQLARGEQALNSIVDWRSQRLVEGARLLAADYGFRSAVQSGDRETIASTLSNHGARIGASEVALLGTDFAPVAIAEGSTWKVAGAAASVGQLASLAARQGGAGAITVIDGQARQMVLVPLRAPLLAGWVVMYFPLPAEVAEDVHKLSATDLTLLSRGSPEEKWSVDFSHASTAQAAELATLDWPTDPARAAAQPAMIERRIGAQTLGLHALPLLLGERLGDGRHAQVLAVLSLSIDESMRPPEDMKIALLVTTLLAFVAFGAGSWYNARRITTPLQALSGAAERLGSGDLATPIRSANTGDEVGELAAAIEHMRVRLAGNQEQMVLSEKLASIGQLAAGVAHEINNPIGFVFSNFGTLEEYLASLFRMLEAYRAAEPALAGSVAAGALARLREEIELDYLLSDIPALMSESRDGLKRVRKIVQDLKDFSHVDSREEWGDRRPAHRPRLDAQHRRQRDQVQGRGRQGVRRAAARRVPAARAEPGVHEPARERGARHRRRTRRGHAAHVRGAGSERVRRGRRHRLRHRATGPQAHLRSVLHHQGSRQGHRPGSLALVRHRQEARRSHRGDERDRPGHDVPGEPAGAATCAGCSGGGELTTALVPRVGIEPTLLAERDFESRASTNFATEAGAFAAGQFATRAVD